MGTGQSYFELSVEAEGMQLEDGLRVIDRFTNIKIRLDNNSHSCMTVGIYLDGQLSISKVEKCSALVLEDNKLKLLHTDLHTIRAELKYNMGMHTEYDERLMQLIII